MRAEALNWEITFVVSPPPFRHLPPPSALFLYWRAGEEVKSPGRGIALEPSLRGGQIRRRGTRSRLPPLPPPSFIFLLDNVPFRVVSRLRRRWLRRCSTDIAQDWGVGNPGGLGNGKGSGTLGSGCSLVLAVFGNGK